MQKRVALEELNQDLLSAKARVDAWAKSKLNQADDLKITQKRTVENDRGKP